MAAYTMPDSMDVSSFLDKPGWYHFAVIDINENPTSQKGDLVDALKLQVQVLDGTEPSQKRREFNPWLNNPNATHKDGGAFCARVHLRLARALGILPNAKPGESVEIVWANGIGRQFVAKLAMQKQKDGSERLGIDGAHIYHVQDDEVKDVPKDANALKLMGVAGKPAATNGNGAASNGNGHARPAAQQVAPAEQPVTAGAAAANSFDDL